MVSIPQTKNIWGYQPLPPPAGLDAEHYTMNRFPQAGSATDWRPRIITNTDWEMHQPGTKGPTVVPRIFFTDPAPGSPWCNISFPYCRDVAGTENRIDLIWQEFDLCISRLVKFNSFSSPAQTDQTNNSRINRWNKLEELLQEGAGLALRHQSFDFFRRIRQRCPSHGSNVFIYLL